MKIGVLGTGTVGQTIGARLVELGHEVTLGSRTANNQRSAEWATQTGAGARAGTFAEASTAGEIVFNCTLGSASVEAVEQAGARNLAGKILVDVANALDASAGMPPRLLRCNDSVAEQIQRALPETKVVKTLNTMWSGLMVRPRLIDETHHNFICGDDAGAKAQVRALLASFGWQPDEIVDLGNLSAARAVEAWLPLCSMIAGVLGGPFNLKILPVSGSAPS